VNMNGIQLSMTFTKSYVTLFKLVKPAALGYWLVKFRFMCFYMLGHDR